MKLTKKINFNFKLNPFFSKSPSIHAVFDKRCTSSLLFICILEIVHVGWAYGTDKWFDNLAEMSMDLSKPTRFLWALAWKLVTPVILAFITVLAWIKHEPMDYDDYKFPAGIGKSNF